MGRGKLILVEGLDRTGKSTQTERLYCRLAPNAELLRFPDRSTEIGQVINKYLMDKSFHLPDQAIHLLFSANRWEVADRIKKLLQDGKHVILDRYVYSGVAYSAAKESPGMDIQWCSNPDRGLLRPDITLFLSSKQDASTRDGFGQERYETSEFQTKVANQFLQSFHKLDNNTVHILDVTGLDIPQVEAQIWTRVQKLLDRNIPQEQFEYF